MEEKEVNKKETIDIKVGAIMLLGTYVLGCFVGAASSNKKIKEAYSQGVMDTFQSLMLRNK